jgi:hypothetical protein
VGGQEQYIVEGQRLLNHPHDFIARKGAFYTELYTRQCDTVIHSPGWSVDRSMRTIFAVLAALAFAAAASAQTYKWVDKDGKVRYGDTPPPGANVTRLKPPPRGVAAPAPEAKKDAAKPLSPEAAFQKRQKEQQDQEEKAAKERAEAESKRVNCERAQAALRTFQSGQRIATTNAAGERVFLEDDQIAKERDRVQRDVQEWCG